jgi:hypothetical protein
MTPNPYESPQHTGYDAPIPAARPLWLRVIAVALTGLALAYVGWVILFACGVAYDYFCWWFGF